MKPPLLDITVVIPAHPARVRSGMLNRAMQSATQIQTMPPSALSVAIDVDSRGAPHTRNRALLGARTEWVAFLDSDDFFLPRHLEELSRHAIDTGADMVYSWFKVMDAAGKILEEDPVFPPTHFTEPFDPDNPIETTITTLVRTELAQQVGFQALNRGEANTGEDRFFTLGVLEAGGKISHLVDKTWIWHHHGANTSGHPDKGDAVSTAWTRSPVQSG